LTDIDRIIGDIYDGGMGDWLSVGRSLFNGLGASNGSLRFRQADGRSVNVFDRSEPAEAQYTAYYCHIDPIRAALTRTASDRGQSSNALLIEDLLDESHYRRSEFYQDFARSNGQQHMLLGIVGDDEHTVIGLFRDGRAFDEREQSALSRLLPHIRRAMQLQQRLEKAELVGHLGHAAFEGLPGAAVVVDADCHILYANSAAARRLSRRDLPVSFSPEANTGKTKLTVDNRGRAMRLRAMISDAAYRGNGGAMRFEIDDATAGRPRQLAVFVLPQPTQFSATAVLAGEGDPVLVLLHELSRPTIISASLLADLFGLSTAESGVAMALLGGQTAEAVARDRDVSLETVRTQIRMVLRKTNAGSLREFERIGAMLDMLAH
jgi:DNA-binding CsgD family transcriptional regulator